MLNAGVIIPKGQMWSLSLWILCDREERPEISKYGYDGC